ncbi:hypothetical protein ACI77J_15100 [Pseudomonas sp. O64]|uniref:hypothetical protein n=1 Tax=Pseudomonas TaxID=286 RepID=UPI000BA0E89A|nr:MULTISPECIES: hypothetical protein [unclassified Pseudomonas]MCV2230475.1 hypothetical protein [Pseudomonas sp. AU10]OZO03803.1 hypothetical protein B7453_14445 [Pseudomonas sp. IB20]
MSLSRIDSGSLALLPQSNPPTNELNLATSIAQSDLPADEVKTNADAELATLLADKHQDDWRGQKLSPQTSVGKWLDLFIQSWNTPPVQAWVKAHNFVMPRFHIVGSTLTVTSLVGDKETTTTFTPSDGTGWWPIGQQVIASAAMLDPQGKGLSGNPGAQLQPSEIAAFYGLNWPISQADAEQLNANGFPVKRVREDPMRSPEIRKLAAREFMDVENETALIKTLLGKVQDKPDDEQIDLSTILQGIKPGSSLAIANRAGLKLLQPLMRDPMMASILRAYRTDSNAQVRLVDGQLFINAYGKLDAWRNVTATVLTHPNLAEILNRAIQHSEKSAKIISSQSSTDVWQLLRFATENELPATLSVSELRNVLNWKLNPLAPQPSLGSHARSYLGDKQSPDSLSAEQRIRVRRTAPETSIPPKLTLLDCSPQPWVGKSPAYIRENADELITQALTQGAGLGRCEPILTALKDDPLSATGDASPSYRKQMIITRDLLVIDPTLGTQRNHIADYNLYSASNTGKTLVQVRTELEQYIAKEKQLPLEQAIVVTHALLATAAPEFLVKGADTVRVGTLSLVNLRVQTALVEMASQGSSRLMSAQQLGSRALLTPLSPEHKQLQAMESAGPIYDWALAQGVVTDRDDYSPSALNTALTAYTQRLADSRLMATDFDRAKSALKTRVEAGEQELARVCPGFSKFLNKPTVLFDPASSIVSSRIVDFVASTASNALGGPQGTAFELAAGPCSIRDLYLSGQLTAGNLNSKKWTFIDPLDKAVFEILKIKLAQLKPVHEVFHHPFMLATFSLASASVTATKMLMSDMPVEDRRRLEFGEVTVYGASMSQRPEKGELTQEQAQQKIGPILFVKDASGAKCYELFPLTNQYVERPALCASMSSLSELYNKNALKDWPILRKSDHPSLPVDIQTSWHFEPAPQNQGLPGDLPNTYSSSRTNEILKVLADEHLLVNPRFLLTQAAGLTYNEAFQQRLDAMDAFVINTLIPFKGNIEELASGNRRRMIIGGFGLGVEIIGALFVVYGAFNGIAKGASVATKLAALGNAALSMFNLPGAVTGTAKSLFRLTSAGVTGVGAVVPKALGKGLVNLRKLAGGGGKNTQSLIRLSPNGAVPKEAIDLLGNTGLINTTYGTNDIIQQSPPTVSSGSTISLAT